MQPVVVLLVQQVLLLPRVVPVELVVVAHLLVAVQEVRLEEEREAEEVAP